MKPNIHDGDVELTPVGLESHAQVVPSRDLAERSLVLERVAHEWRVAEQNDAEETGDVEPHVVAGPGGGER